MKFGPQSASVLAIIFLGTLSGCSQPTRGPQSNLEPAEKEQASANAAQPAEMQGAAKLTTDQNKADQNAAVPSASAEPINAAEFPMPGAAEKPMYTADTNSILFHQEGTVEDQVKYYTDALQKLGWTKQDSSEIADGVAFLDFNKGSYSITVTINPGDEGLITTIAQGNGINVPQSLEDDTFDVEMADDEDQTDDDNGGCDSENDG